MPLSLFGQNIRGENKRRKYLQVFDGCGALLVGASQPQRDQYRFQSRVRSAITISHLIRNKANANPVTIYSDNCWGGGAAARGNSYLFSRMFVSKSELVIA